MRSVNGDVCRVETHVGGLTHVTRQVLSKGFWVGGRQGEHLFIHGERGEREREREREREGATDR